ncbi:hypothetical protein D3C78_1126120 [compost metagenome]
MTQADHPGVGRARGGRVDGLGQGQHLRPGFGRAEQEQAVGAAVGDHLGGAGGAFGLAAVEGVVEHLGGVHHPGVAHVVDRVVLLVGLVQLAHQLLDAGDIGRAVADDQRVGRGHGGQVAVLRHQRANQRDQLGHGILLHLQHAGFQGVGRACGGAVGPGFGVGHDARLVVLGDDREPVGAHHREKQLIDLAQAQRRLRHHRDLALHARVDDKGLPADAGHLLDEVADIRILHVDGPGFPLLAGRARGDGRLG